MIKLILASSSPRRKELLSYLNIPFTCQQSNVDESILPEESPEEIVSRLAKLKAEIIAKKNPDALVLGSDTLVALALEGNRYEILGKPTDKKDALRMLRKLQGREHLVFTGISLQHFEKKYFFDKSVISKVKFIKLSDQEILDYIETGEPMDKAGAYALQGIGSCFIESVEGSFTSVIGLPLSEIYQELQRYVNR